MAQPPHPAPKPPLKPAAPTLRDPAEGKPPAVIGGQHEQAPGPRPTIGVKGEPIDDGSRDPDTIAEEQRRRAGEIEGMGVEAWKAAHDERSEQERGENKRIEGAKAP